jgi:hypothetical protein
MNKLCFPFLIPLLVDRFSQHEEAKIVQSVKRSDSSECFSLPTEFTESSRDNTNNFNSFVFIGKSIADGMKNEVISKGVLNLDKTPGTSSSKN